MAVSLFTSAVPIILVFPWTLQPELQVFFASHPPSRQKKTHTGAVLTLSSGPLALFLDIIVENRCVLPRKIHPNTLPASQSFWPSPFLSPYSSRTVAPAAAAGDDDDATAVQAAAGAALAAAANDDDATAATAG